MNQATRAMRLVRRTAKKLRRSVDTVALRRQLRATPGFGPDDAGHVDVLLNFPDGLRNLYQVQQWYGPLEHLGKTYSVAILCYRPETARKIAEETDLKVILTPSFTNLSEVRDVLTPKVILYPNQNYANYRVLGLDRTQHVFICHGESDKIYMASNWVKVFNYFFIAGQASHDRLMTHVRNYDVDERTIRIGRPQIDIPSAPQIEKSPGRVTVLYAPTWEGGRSTMRYGSVATHGRAIIDALLGDERFQVIYRPHPRTGVHLHDVKAADEEIRERITAANENDPLAGHFIDDTPFGWQLDFADFMITDISAVAYDWLTTAKPLLITRPAESLTVMPDSGYLAETNLLDAKEAGSVNSLVIEMLNDPAIREEQNRWSEYYYGDRAPGASTARFEAAVARVIAEVDAFTAESGHASSRSDSQLDYDELEDETDPETGSAVVRYAHAAGTLVANQVSRYLHDSALAESFDGAITGRTATILVTCMAHHRNLDNLIDWLPTLEAVNRTHSVAILTGNLRTYETIKQMTALRLIVAQSAVRTETIVQEISPELIMHFEQSKLNLREATYRSAAHVYVGESANDDWINNRVRLFDTVLAPSARQASLIRSSLLNLPQTIDIREVPDDRRDVALRELVRDVGSSSV